MVNKKFVYNLFNENKSLEQLIKTLKLKNVLFLFNCGFGDFLMFMDIFDHIKIKYPYVNFKIGASENFGYHLISDDIEILEEDSKNKDNDLIKFYLLSPSDRYLKLHELKSKYDIIIDIKFYEPICKREFRSNCSMTKSEYCMRHELKIKDNFKQGFEGFKIKHPEYSDDYIDENNIIGIHSIGNSGSYVNKNIDSKDLNIIRNSIINCGYKPLLFYNTGYRFQCESYKKDIFGFKDNELIPIDSNLKDIINHISRCKFFIGILSGPIVAANKILSPNRCLSIEKKGAYDWFSFKKIVGDDVLNIRNINPIAVKHSIKILENKYENRKSINIGCIKINTKDCHNMKNNVVIHNDINIIENEIPINDIKLKEDCLSWIDGDTIFLHSWPGVGDNYWIYNKLKNLNKKIHFIFNYQNNEMYPKRSHQLMEFCSNTSFSYYTSNDDKLYDIYVNAYPENFTKKEIMKELYKGSKYSFLPNRYIEIGNHLKDVWSDMELNTELINFNKFNNLEIDKNFDNSTIFIHPFTYNKDKSKWVDLSINMIKLLSKRLNKNGFRIGICGGIYDCDNWNEIFKMIKNEIGYEPYNLVGKSLLNTLYTLNISSGWIGPVNGLAAITVFNNITSCVIWPQYLHKMVNTITNPDIDNNLYNHICAEKGLYVKNNIMFERRIMDNFINYFKKIYDIGK